MSLKTIRRALVVTALLAVGPMAEAQPVTPRLAAPGDAIGSVGVRSECPTFIWGSVEDADSYELAVFEWARDEMATESDAAVIRSTVPGFATVWIPPAAKCLHSDRRYVWTVRAVGKGGASDWAEAWIFDVLVDQRPADPGRSGGDPTAPSAHRLVGATSNIMIHDGVSGDNRLGAPVESHGAGGGIKVNDEFVLAGWERVSGGPFDCAADITCLSFAMCSADKKVLGGGVQSSVVGSDIEMVSSYPQDDGTWTGAIHNGQLSPIQYTVWAICATVE